MQVPDGKKINTDVWKIWNILTLSPDLIFFFTLSSISSGKFKSNNNSQLSKNIFI